MIKNVRFEDENGVFDFRLEGYNLEVEELGGKVRYESPMTGEIETHTYDRIKGDTAIVIG